MLNKTTPACPCAPAVKEGMGGLSKKLTVRVGTLNALNITYKLCSLRSLGLRHIHLRKASANVLHA